MNLFDQEMVIFLQEYVQINTMHPRPDYQKVIHLFKQQATRDGFVHEEVVLPSNNSVLIISYRGTDPDLASIALNHHMDTVPTPNVEQWTTDPLAGEIYNGRIIGRGTQDMKGVGVAHYFALKQLKDAGVRFDRTVHLFIVPDEERGGFNGTQEFIETDEFKKLNVGFVLDEGDASGNANLLYLVVDERKPIQIYVNGKGESAHGSLLMHHNVVHEMILFLHRLVALQKEQQKKATELFPGLLLSINITSVQTGVITDGAIALNIIPGEVCATIDMRVPPTMTLVYARELFEHELVQFPSLNYTIEATVPDRKSYDMQDSYLYRALAQVISDYGMSAQHYRSESTSDLRYYRAQDIEGLGFTPFTSTKAIHETNESISIEELIKGKNILRDFLFLFCSKDKP